MNADKLNYKTVKFNSQDDYLRTQQNTKKYILKNESEQGIKLPKSFSQSNLFNENQLSKILPSLTQDQKPNNLFEDIFTSDNLQRKNTRKKGANRNKKQRKAQKSDLTNILQMQDEFFKQFEIQSSSETKYEKLKSLNIRIQQRQVKIKEKVENFIRNLSNINEKQNLQKKEQFPMINSKKFKSECNSPQFLLSNKDIQNKISYPENSVGIKKFPSKKTLGHRRILSYNILKQNSDFIPVISNRNSYNDFQLLGKSKILPSFDTYITNSKEKLRLNYQ